MADQERVDRGDGVEVKASYVIGVGNPAGVGGEVNLNQVAGTAVSAGAGAVTAGTQRTTLASDDPAVTALALLHTDNLGVGKTASATFTPAASSHTAPAVNGGAGTFALSAPSGCLFLITDADLEIDGGTAEASAWRVYLYNVTPPSALTDTTAWDLPSGDRASYLGYIDLGTAVDLGSTQWVQNASVNRAVKLAGTGLFGYLVNLTTLTPAAVAHTVTLRGTPV